MKKNLRDTVIENIETNYMIFRETELAKSKAKIFDNSYQINFMDNMRDYFLYSELTNSDYSILARDKDCILDNLHKHYMRSWDNTVSSNDEIADFIRDYIDVNSERGSEM